MSTVFKNAPQHTEKLQLRVVPTSITDRFKGQVDNITSLEADIIAALPDLEEDAIVDLRQKAEKLGIFSWVVGAACDAAIWNHHSAQRSGYKSAPGNPDTQGVGIMAAVAKRAKEIKSTYKTMRENARIYNTFNGHLNAAVQVLPEKQFFLEALKADDPHAALEQFIAQKQGNNKFSPALAEKLIKDAKKDASQERASLVQEFSQPDEKTLSEHTQEFLGVVRQYRNSCPDKDFARRMYDQIIEDFEDHLFGVMADAATRKAVLAASENGCLTVDQIVNRTKLSKKEVEHILESLARDGAPLTKITGVSRATL